MQISSFGRAARLSSQQLISQGQGGERCKLKVCRPFSQLIALSAFAPTWKQLCLSVPSSAECLEVSQTPSMLNTSEALPTSQRNLTQFLHQNTCITNFSKQHVTVSIFLFFPPLNYYYFFNVAAKQILIWFILSWPKYFAFLFCWVQYFYCRLMATLQRSGGDRFLDVWMQWEVIGYCGTW